MLYYMGFIASICTIISLAHNNCNIILLPRAKKLLEVNRFSLVG